MSPRKIRAACLVGGVSAVVVEILQRQPELFPYGHELGEVIRNLGYALVTAYAFYFFLEEKPARDRKRTAYTRNSDILLQLATAGNRLLESLVRNQMAILDHDIEYKDASQVLQQLSGTNMVWPVTLSPFNSLYRTCERIERHVRSLGHDEQAMDDTVRHALKVMGGLRERFEDDITILSIRLAKGQEPLMDMPTTLGGHASMFMLVVDACRDLAHSLLDNVNEDLRPRFIRALQQPLISADEARSPFVTDQGQRIEIT